MSDFDKEAERQRLREKYEKDRQKREQTQRMSELLLKGATMTNRHCDTCGDPIFRWNGQEFCPTCDVGEDGNVHVPDSEDVEGTAGTEADTGQGAGDVEVTAVEEPAPTGDVEDDAADAAEAEAGGTGADATPEPAGPSTTRPEESDASGTAEPGEVDASADRSRTREPAADEEATPDREPETGGAPAPAGGPREPTEGANFATVRASLARTLARHAEAAEAADDPRQAREHLDAAREAAETLAALRR
jgi:uncharacterized Zn finger protein (UPF0148 family)